MIESGGRRKINEVLNEVLKERLRQDEKWGEQNHPDGTTRLRGAEAGLAKEACDEAMRDGSISWRHILREEVAEAFAEPGPQLRAELIQVAAVAAAWVEAIDRRESEAGR